MGAEAHGYHDDARASAQERDYLTQRDTASPYHQAQSARQIEHDGIKCRHQFLPSSNF